MFQTFHVSEHAASSRAAEMPIDLDSDDQLSGSEAADQIESRLRQTSGKIGLTKFVYRDEGTVQYANVISQEPKPQDAANTWQGAEAGLAATRLSARLRWIGRLVILVKVSQNRI
jgi:hypothetical protein